LRVSPIVSLITGGLVSGETMKVPPAPATAWTSRRRSTVPAPIIARSPKASLAAEMLARASGELSGTSIMVMPALTRLSQTATTSDVVTPRRMAMRWRWSVMRRSFVQP
jgi:hypothetical protein